MRSSPVSLKVYWSKSLVKPAVALVLILTAALSAFVIEVSNSVRLEALASASATMAHVLADPILLGEQLEILKRVSLVAKNHGLQVTVRDASDDLLLNYPAGTDLADGKDVVSVPIENAAGVQIGRILSRSTVKPSLLGVVLVSAILTFIFILCAAYWLLKSTKGILDDIFAIQVEDVVSKQGSTHRFRFEEVSKVQDALLSRARQLIEFERQKSKFELARQVAHDIRSPLSAVSIVADMAQGLDPKLQALLRAAVTQIEKTSFEILEQGVEHSQPVLTNVQSVQDAIAVLREVVCVKKLEYCRRNEVSIEQSLSVHDASLTLRFDPAKLTRVLSNLVNNSVEAFSVSGGKVVTRIVQRPQELVLTVEDNGKGMSAEVKSAGLLPGGTSGKMNGHGLGLSNAREVIASWGGSLTINSQLGLGTQINISLPIQ